jgi:hypothetical protein
MPLAPRGRRRTAKSNVARQYANSACYYTSGSGQRTALGRYAVARSASARQGQTGGQGRIGPSRVLADIADMREQVTGVLRAHRTQHDHIPRGDRGQHLFGAFAVNLMLN